MLCLKHPIFIRGVNQNLFIDGRCMIITSEHEIERDQLFLSTVTWPIIEGCVFVFFIRAIKSAVPPSCVLRVSTFSDLNLI